MTEHISQIQNGVLETFKGAMLQVIELYKEDCPTGMDKHLEPFVLRTEEAASINGIVAVVADLRDFILENKVYLRTENGKNMYFLLLKVKMIIREFRWTENVVVTDDSDRVAFVKLRVLLSDIMNQRKVHSIRRDREKNQNENP